MHYFDALNCLFRIENALRLLVFIVLKKTYAGDWSNVTISTEEAGPLSINSIAKRRSQSEERFDYLREKTNCPLLYLTAGELVNLMLSDTYWKLFKSYFPGAPGVMEVKLQEIACVRNALAHFRPISEESVDHIKKTGMQILSRFNSDLGDLVDSHLAKPLVRWKNKIRLSGQDTDIELAITAKEDATRKWIILTMEYFANDSAFKWQGATCNLSTSLIDLDEFLESFPAVTNACVFVTEHGFSYKWDGDTALPKIKQLFTFRFPKTKQPKEHASKIPHGIPQDLMPRKDPTLVDSDKLLRRHVLQINEPKFVRRNHGFHR